ncbi:enoyl-CoA hydratase/carnithine racemase [Mycena olivaceomarginata]|nr:enoyl-CoA hydratase/carnithine racemase [Mycena olivaceomarginata]
MSPTLNPPAVSGQLLVSFPKEHVLQLTLNRPKSLNASTPQMMDDVRKVLNWFEDEPSLWVVIITGSGRAFCAGADLKAYLESRRTARPAQHGRISTQQYLWVCVHFAPGVQETVHRSGQWALLRGGTELVLNCDLVVASKDANFGLPEVKRGVVAIQGGIPRLARIAGHQLASEMLLLGKTITADDARNRFGFVNVVVPPTDVLPTALDLASQIIANSPDSVQSTKKGLLLTYKHNNESMVWEHVRTPESAGYMLGDNIKEGLRAFNEVRGSICLLKSLTDENAETEPGVWQNPGTKTKL